MSKSLPLFVLIPVLRIKGYLLDHDLDGLKTHDNGWKPSPHPMPFKGTVFPVLNLFSHAPKLNLNPQYADYSEHASLMLHTLVASLNTTQDPDFKSDIMNAILAIAKQLGFRYLSLTHVKCNNL